MKDPKDYLKYDSSTGVFTWIKKPSRVTKLTDVVGCKRPDGYYVIGLNKKQYLLHRLAWAMVYGVWPKFEIDHINGDKSDNRISNLRDVPPSINQHNKGIHRNGKLLGVTKVKNRVLFKASAPKNYLNYSGPPRHLGYFKTAELAHEAVVKFCGETHEKTHY